MVRLTDEARSVMLEGLRARLIEVRARSEEEAAPPPPRPDPDPSLDAEECLRRLMIRCLPRLDERADEAGSLLAGMLHEASGEDPRFVDAFHCTWEAGGADRLYPGFVADYQTVLMAQIERLSR